MNAALSFTATALCRRCPAPASVCGVHANGGEACRDCAHPDCADIRERAAVACQVCGEALTADRVTTDCGRYHAECAAQVPWTGKHAPRWFDAVLDGDAEFLARVEARVEPAEGWA